MRARPSLVEKRPPKRPGSLGPWLRETLLAVIGLLLLGCCL